MPTKTLASQNGNSCAAHCTVISINEIKNTSLNEAFAEQTLWPAIQFVDANDGITGELAQTNNSDPRRVVTEVSKRWPGVTAKLLCDSKQKDTAMSFVTSGQDKQGLQKIFGDIAKAGIAAPTQLDELAFYNCSYTMHSGAKPSAQNFTGLHNILVTYSGGKAWYYNPNEDTPSWKQTSDWKQLEGQNNNSNSYVFTGVSVVIF